MKKFSHGQRVLVLRDEEGRDINERGEVCRLRIRDHSAWIALDTRGPDHIHGFPADDPDGRGTHIAAYPEDCERA